ncbi:MAG TPA: hypothetical protein VGQ83_35450 [Polyangia bacterium]|jgi:hypothetical protein
MDRDPTTTAPGEIDDVTLRRARRGDERACRDLVGCYEEAVFAQLARLLGPAARGPLVEELAQETFLRLLRELGRWAGSPAGLATRLAALAGELAQEELRRRSTGAQTTPAPVAAAPRSGFADRVLEIRRDGPRVAPLPWWSAARTRFLVFMGVLVAGISVLVLYPVMRSPMRPPLPGSGARTTAVRETILLGGRGVAVAEAGSGLVWAIDRKGAARVNQAAGDVFYRVEAGGAFLVSTPAGDVTAVGTCFRVAVDAAPAAAAAATVSVAEGRVLIGNRGGNREIGPGERGTLLKDGRGERAEAASAPAPR